MKLNFRQRSRRLRALRLVPVLMAFALGGGSLGAQIGSAAAASGSLPEGLGARPIEIRLSINLVALDGRIVMKMDQLQPTVSGRPVGVTLVQENQLRVEALFTPIWRTETELTLHVQGEIWVGDTQGGYGDAPVAKAYRAMPVALGDSVLFFPLGGERELRGSTRRFHFRSEPFPVDPPQQSESEDGTVALVIVIAVQVDLLEKNGAAEQQNISS